MSGLVIVSQVLTATNFNHNSSCQMMHDHGRAKEKSPMDSMAHFNEYLTVINYYELNIEKIMELNKIIIIKVLIFFFITDNRLQCCHLSKRRLSPR